MRAEPHERRVAVALHEPVLGGATLSVLRVVPLLAERGWRFSFWAPRPSATFDHLADRGHDVAGAPRYVEYSLRAWRLPPGPLRRAASVPDYLRAFHRFLDERRPALVHANSIICTAEAVAAKRAGHRVLLHVHEMVPRSARGALLRRAASRLDGAVAVSRASVASLARPGFVPGLVYEAAPVPDRPLTLRERPRPFRVGTVAVVSTRKGSDLFVAAARRLMAEAPGRFEFEMVGAPNDAIERRWAREVLAEAHELGVDHRERADVPRRLASWDAFALPSRSDPFPLSVLEAMGSGLPVVGAAVDGIGEQLADGCGVLVAPGDPDALAAGIARIAAMSHADRVAMGRAARERVASRFSLAEQADALEAAYARALGRSGAPA